MIKQLDISASRIINQLISKISTLSSFLKIITHTSSGKIYPLYTIIIPFILESGFEIVRIGLIAFAFQVPVYLLSKNLIKRDRPSSNVGINSIMPPPDKYSFPSGHCASSTLFTLIINQYMPWLTVYFIVWMLIIFISRVGLGLHYLSDCIFGVVLGFISFLIANQILSIFF
jgi:undecaprenyl-diphosphatase